MLRATPQIERQMRSWLELVDRAGMIALPPEYVNFHAEAAKDDLARRDWDVLREELVDADDCDGSGMRVVQVIVYFSRHDIEVLRWHESGAWFRLLPSGGWVREHEMLKSQGE